MTDSSKQAWDVYWHDFRESPMGEFAKLTLNEFEAVVSQLLDRSKLKLVIEAGSGIGTTSIPFIKYGTETVLVDISIEALKAAKNLFLPLPQEKRPYLVIGDALHIPIRDCSADLVFNQGVLEHFDTNKSVMILCEMKRVSRTVMVSVPYEINVGYKLAKLLCKVLKKPWPFGETIERDYTMTTLVNELQKAGLRPLIVRKWGRSWALKHLSVVISSKTNIAEESKKRPVVELVAYTIARVLSVLTFSFEQLIVVSVQV